MSEYDNRRLAANEAFAHHDFGEMVVKDTGGWDDLGDDEWCLPVFIEGPGGKDGYGTSAKRMFVVRFRPRSSEVKEAYLGQ